MKNFLRTIKSRRFLLLTSAFASISLGMLVGSAVPSKLSPTIGEVKIVNKTSSLKVVALKTTADNHLLIRLQNISSKDLNGYALLVNGARITNDFSSGDRVIAPGQTDELEIPIDSPLPDFTLLATMFTDGSIEGDEVTTARLGEWRIGLKKQLTRSLSILNAALVSPDVDSAATLDKLESQFSSLSLESDAAKPHSARGFRDGRDDLIAHIQVLRDRRQRHGVVMQRQRLLDLKARIERRIASL